MPNSRKEFEYNMHVLSEQMRQGLISFSPQTRRAVKGLFNVKNTPNGRANLMTVDEAARSIANMTTIRKMEMDE